MSRVHELTALVALTMRLCAAHVIQWFVFAIYIALRFNGLYINYTKAGIICLIDVHNQQSTKALSKLPTGPRYQVVPHRRYLRT